MASARGRNPLFQLYDRSDGLLVAEYILRADFRAALPPAAAGARDNDSKAQLCRRVGAVAGRSPPPAAITHRRQACYFAFSAACAAARRAIGTR